MMERWYERHKDTKGFDPGMPFKGFDGLLNADLSNINLSEIIIQGRAEERKRHDPEQSGRNPCVLRNARTEVHRGVSWGRQLIACSSKASTRPAKSVSRPGK